MMVDRVFIGLVDNYQEMARKRRTNKRGRGNGILME